MKCEVEQYLETPDRIIFTISSGEDFKDVVQEIKLQFKFPDRKWDAEKEQWSVSHTPANRDKLIQLFPEIRDILRARELQLSLF